MRVGVISGYGLLPVLSVKALKEKGAYVAAFALKEGCNHVDNIENHADVVYRISAGQVGKVLKLIEKERLSHIILVGKIEINILEKGLQLDLKALWMLTKLKFRSTDTISLAIISELKKGGLKILSQKEVLKSYILPTGEYSKKKPSDNIKKDMEFGFAVAKEIGRIDLGQSVVVEKGKVMAVESAEGTDATFARGCALSSGSAVAVKVAKPFQDEHFDLPVVGIDTLKSVAENGGTALAFEADETIIIDMDACIEYADEHSIIFCGIKF